MRTATCHTPDCENAEIPIEMGPPVIVDDLPPGPIYCGPCGQEITDVTDDGES